MRGRFYGKLMPRRHLIQPGSRRRNITTITIITIITTINMVPDGAVVMATAIDTITTTIITIITTVFGATAFGVTAIEPGGWCVRYHVAAHEMR